MENDIDKSKICLSCMECCKSIGIYLAYPYTPKIKEFYEVRGATVSEKTIYDQTLTFIEFPFPCPNLDSIKGCLIYDNRPEVCKDFPKFDNEVLDVCQLHKLGLI